MSTLMHPIDWIGASVPNPGPAPIPGLQPKTDMVLGWLKTACLVAIVAGALLGIVMIPAGKAVGNRMYGNIGAAGIGAAGLCAVLYVVIVPLLNALLA